MAYTTDPAVGAMEYADLEQLIADAQAEKTERDISTAAVAVQATIQNYIDDASREATIGASGLGANAIADTVNGEWVQISFPVQTLSGYKLAFVVLTLRDMVSYHNAEWVTQDKKIRLNGNKALSYLSALHDLLTA